VRARLALGGLSDPGALPTLHAILDVVEQLIVEAKANEGGDALQRFYFDLYRPDDREVRKAIETSDTDTDFDAFAALGLS
jgi:hypothetical protein